METPAPGPSLFWVSQSAVAESISISYNQACKTLGHLQNPAIARAVQVVASEPNGPAFEPRSSPIPESTFQAAQNGEASALDRILASLRKREAEKALAIRATAAAARDAQGTLTPAMARTVDEAVTVAIGASRIARHPAPASPGVAPQPSAEIFHVLAVWRHSSGSYRDYTELAETILRQTWDEFAHPSQLRFLNPPTSQQTVLQTECAIGSATAGTVSVWREGVKTRVHALWEKIVPAVGRTKRLIIVGADSLAADTESLEYLLSRTQADIVAAHGHAKYQVFPVQEVLAFLRDPSPYLDQRRGSGNRHRNHFFESILDGAMKRFLVTTGANAMVENNRISIMAAAVDRDSQFKNNLPPNPAASSPSSGPSPVPHQASQDGSASNGPASSSGLSNQCPTSLQYEGLGRRAAEAPVHARPARSGSSESPDPGTAGPAKRPRAAPRSLPRDHRRFSCTRLIGE
ncbi:unnamed protein product [Parajaminaea phylloscopi]